MSSAAPSTAADQQRTAHRRRRQTKPPVTRRSAIQLLIGVLIVGAIPIVSTVRILQANALRNEQARADSALSDQLQNGLRELGRLGDNASTNAHDLAGSPVVQRAVITHDDATLRRVAGQTPGLAIYRGSRRVAGHAAGPGVQRSIWLTVNGVRAAKVVASVALGPKLSARLTRDAPHGRGDRLLLTKRGRVLGGSAFATKGRIVRLGGVDYRGLPALVPDAGGIRLMALRPKRVIDATVAPYQARVRYAALGSFSLLILVALLFAGPIMRLLGDFRRVSSQATTDSLTGLANRRTLDEELVLEWRRADRVGESLAFVLLDLDNFKQVNDTHGHQAGDAVLRAVGQILLGGVRQVDLAGRYGGEEFALILPETDLPGALKLAERLRVALEAAAVEHAEGKTLRVTASFGVALKDNLGSADELVAIADEALYAAKRAGKNRVVPDPEDARAEPKRPERRKPKKAAAGKKRTTPAKGEI
jgi:diguanylate cyclase (GGDEF)-like protein